MITRKKFINGLGGFIAMAPSVLDAKINKEVPSASRIKMATVGAPNINSFKKLIRVVDLLGREVAAQNKQPLLYIYDDGTIERRMVIATERPF